MTWVRIFLEEAWETIRERLWLTVVLLSLVAVLCAWWIFGDMDMEVGQAAYERLAVIKQDTSRNVAELIHASIEDGQISKREYIVICMQHDEWRVKIVKERLRR